MSKDLELVGGRKTIELQHDRWIQGGHVAVPNVVGDAGEKNIGISTFKRLRHGKLGYRMALPKIFAKKQRVNPSGVSPNNYVLIIVRENLRLNEIARTE